VILEKSSNIKFHKISPTGAELFHANKQRDRRTDLTKLRDAFRNFCEKRLKTELRRKGIKSEYGKRREEISTNTT
jgi:hypothetical protein